MNETLSATGETQLKAWLNGSGHTLTPDFGGDLSRNLESDLDFLEERLGQLPLGTAHLLLLRPPGGVSDGGWARTALNAIHVERDSGVLDREWPAIALHELAHHWFGRWVDLGADASWLEEGMPNLLKEMRYPGVTTTGPTAFENPPDRLFTPV